jgi:hypothetical protein
MGEWATGWSIRNFQSGSGTWDVTDGGLTFTPPKVKLIPNDNHTSILLMGQTPPYSILFYYAVEPDDDSVMVFEKES